MGGAGGYRNCKTCIVIGKEFTGPMDVKQVYLHVLAIYFHKIELKPSIRKTDVGMLRVADSVFIMYIIIH